MIRRRRDVPLRNMRKPLGVTMSVNDLSGMPEVLPDNRAGIWRVWFGPLTAVTDAAVVAALVYAASFAYHLGATNLPGLWPLDGAAPIRVRGAASG